MLTKTKHNKLNVKNEQPFFRNKSVSIQLSQSMENCQCQILPYNSSSVLITRVYHRKDNNLRVH